MIRQLILSVLLSVPVVSFSQELAFPPTPTPMVTPAPMSPEAFDTSIFPTDVMEAATDVVAIHYNGFRRSYTEKCGCASNPMGGIDKEAQILERLKANNIPALSVDGGGSVRDMGSSMDLIRNEYIFKAYGAMGFKAVNVAYPEIGYGIDKLKAASETGGYKLISANTLDKDGQLAFEPYSIEEITFPGGNVAKIGFIGVTRPKSRSLAPTAPQGATYEVLSSGPATTPSAQARNSTAGFSHASPSDALLKYIPEVKEKADFVVVMYYDTRGEVEKVAREKLQGAVAPDVVIATEFVSSVNTSTSVIDDTKVVSSGQEGRQAGVMFLKLEGDKPVFAANKLVEIVQSIPSVPEIQKIVEEGKAATQSGASKPVSDQQLAL